jgi:hypothetical protein
MVEHGTLSRCREGFKSLADRQVRMTSRGIDGSTPCQVCQDNVCKAKDSDECRYGISILVLTYKYMRNTFWFCMVCGEHLYEGIHKTNWRGGQDKCPFCGHTHVGVICYGGKIAGLYPECITCGDRFSCATNRIIK